MNQNSSERIMRLYEKPNGARSHWVSFENQTLDRGKGGLENLGAKGHPFEPVRAGETKTLLDVRASGIVTRIWLTVTDRSPEMLRSLRLEMFWDGCPEPAVSAPLGDFFGVGLGLTATFECALFSNPEGRSFNCFVPMPFRSAARITLANESEVDLKHLFYDVDLVTGVEHSPGALYFHSSWRRESPNRLGEEFEILPRVSGAGRFLGCNVGVIVNEKYEGAWWGEGEVKVRLGDDAHPTLCGTGAEDYIGTGWGQGFFAHRTQGCLIAGEPKNQWSFYRHHVDDPVYFDDGCRVGIQTIGGTSLGKVLGLHAAGVPVIPVSIDTGEVGGLVGLFDSDPHFDLAKCSPEAWCNFWRQDDWSATAYFYSESP